MHLQMRFINVLHHGRGPQITDVILDSMGVLLGICVVILIIKIYKFIVKKHQNIPECKKKLIKCKK